MNKDRIIFRLNSPRDKDRGSLYSYRKILPGVEDPLYNLANPYKSGIFVWDAQNIRKELKLAPAQVSCPSFSSGHILFSSILLPFPSAPSHTFAWAPARLAPFLSAPSSSLPSPAPPSVPDLTAPACDEDNEIVAVGGSADDSAPAAAVESKDSNEISLRSYFYWDLQYHSILIRLGQIQSVENPLREVTQAHLASVQGPLQQYAYDYSRALLSITVRKPHPATYRRIVRAT